MLGPIDLAHGWIAKGDNDRLAARILLQASGPLDAACFNTQQAAEKYLKAVIAFFGKPIPHIHDLEEIYGACRLVAPALTLDQNRLSSLTPFAVQVRYSPDFRPDALTVLGALDVVDEVRAAIVVVLPPAAVPTPTPLAPISSQPPPPPPAPAPPPGP